jgi:hypothetical protein
VAIGAFLQRNPGLAFVAVGGDVIAGAVICGTDDAAVTSTTWLCARPTNDRELADIWRKPAWTACANRGLRNAIFLCIGEKPLRPAVLGIRWLGGTGGIGLDDEDAGLT